MTNAELCRRLREVADIKTGVLYSRRKMLNDAADAIEALTARAEKAEAVLHEGWQDMTTAPMDGKHCILAVREGAFIYSVQGAYQDGQWNAVHRDNVKPLCWMSNVRLPDRIRGHLADKVISSADLSIGEEG